MAGGVLFLMHNVFRGTGLLIRAMTVPRQGKARFGFRKAVCETSMSQVTTHPTHLGTLFLASCY